MLRWKDFGIGILVGVSGSIVMHHVLCSSNSKEVQQLMVALKELQREWRELRTILSGDVIDGNRGAWGHRRRNIRAGSPVPVVNTKAGNGKSKSTSEVISLHDSTSDEEELDFEEATGGFVSPCPLPREDTGDREFESIAHSTEELSKFLLEIDVLFNGSHSDHEEALQRMLAKCLQFSSNKEYLWRLARAKVLVSEVCRIQGDDEERKRLVFEARENAKAAIDLDEDLSDGHKYYAITQGIIVDWVSFREAANLGKEYKEHMERALELKPNEPYLNHLYGRFLFNIANLGWMQRKAAIMMYSLPQSLGLDDALMWFDKAEDLQPGFSNLNPFYSAKCYIEKGQTDVAIDFLHKAITFAGSSFEENEVRREAEELLQQLTKNG